MDNLKDKYRSKLLMKLPGPPVMLVAIAVLAVVAIFLRLSSATNVSANFGDLSLAESTYPNIVGSRIDTCALCHTSAPNLNPYGAAYKAAGRGLASSLHSIENADSDGDGFTNIQEINALTFPGDPNDHPTSATATPTSVLPSPTATRVSPSATPTAVSPSATPGGPTATMVPTMQFTPKPTREFTPRPTHEPRMTRTPRTTQTCTDEDQDSDDGGSTGGSGGGGDDLHITTQDQGGSFSRCDSGGDDGGSGGGDRGGGRGRGGGGDGGGGDDLFSGTSFLLPDRILADFAGLTLFH